MTAIPVAGCAPLNAALACARLEATAALRRQVQARQETGTSEL